VTHLVVFNRAEENGWHTIAAKAATSLLRYLEPISTPTGDLVIISADKAFYLAGCAWKRVRSACVTRFSHIVLFIVTVRSVHVQVPERHNDAFVFLNAFLDIFEAIQDGNAASLDLSDLSETGIYLKFPLPARDAVYVGEMAVEQVKEWVLEAAMQQNISQEVSTRSCSNCGKDIFAGQLACSQCWHVADSCAVTGWPISVGDKVETKGTFKVKASRADFNTYVQQYGACPVSGTPQAIIQ
jgi:hypothetical protein